MLLPLLVFLSCIANSHQQTVAPTGPTTMVFTPTDYTTTMTTIVFTPTTADPNTPTTKYVFTPTDTTTTTIVFTPTTPDPTPTTYVFTPAESTTTTVVSSTTTADPNIPTKYVFTPTGTTTTYVFTPTTPPDEVYYFTPVKKVDRCGTYTNANGTSFPSRCNTVDANATCSMDISQPYCTCTAGWTGTFCTVSVDALGRIGGNATDSLVDVIKGGTTHPASLIVALPPILSFLTDAQRAAMGYTLDEMILEASYEEEPLDVQEAFTSFNDPSLGNCFTFNHFNGSSIYLTRGLSSRYGLKVALNFQMHEYAPWVESAGIYTFVHSIGQDVYLESVKHTVQPGHTDQIAMRKTTLTRLKDIFSYCAQSKSAASSYYFQGNYSVDGCLRSCYQDSVYRSCGCMDPSYARNKAIKACNFEKLSCVYEMTARRGDAFYWPECKCPAPCREEQFKYETSRAMLLQRPSLNVSLRSDITIYFISLDLHAQVEQWTFPFSRVLGLTGGFAGVLLGASIVFIVELILLVVRVPLILCGGSDRLLRMKTE